MSKAVTMTIPEFLAYERNKTEQYEKSNISTKLGLFNQSLSYKVLQLSLLASTVPILANAEEVLTEDPAMPGHYYRGVFEGLSDPELYKSMAENIKTIATLCEFLLHPTKLLGAMWNGFVSVSYWVCLAVGLFGLVCMWFGIRKYKKAIPLSIFIYTFVQAVNCQLGQS